MDRKIQDVQAYTFQHLSTLHQLVHHRHAVTILIFNSLVIEYSPSTSQSIPSHKVRRQLHQPPNPTHRSQPIAQDPSSSPTSTHPIRQIHQPLVPLTPIIPTSTPPPTTATHPGRKPRQRHRQADPKLLQQPRQDSTAQQRHNHHEEDLDRVPARIPVHVPPQRAQLVQQVGNVAVAGASARGGGVVCALVVVGSAVAGGGVRARAGAVARVRVRVGGFVVVGARSVAAVGRGGRSDKVAVCLAGGRFGAEPVGGGVGGGEKAHNGLSLFDLIKFWCFQGSQVQGLYP